MAEVGHRIGDVVRYRDREMSPDESRDFEVHLSTCPDCQEALRAAEAGLSTFDELVGPRRAPLDMDEAMRRMRKGEAAAVADRRRRRLVLGMAIAAAVVVAAAFALTRAPAPVPREEIVKGPVPAKEYHPKAAPIAERKDAGS